MHQLFILGQSMRINHDLRNWEKIIVIKSQPLAIYNLPRVLKNQINKYYGKRY